VKNFRKIYVLLLLIGTQLTYSQVYKFKTTSVTLSEKTPKDTWSKWTEPAQTNLVITLDTKKSRIVVYSQTIQLFEILEYIDEKETETDKTVAFVCKDNMGEDCNISIITRKYQEYRMQLYITYEDRIINYNIEVL
jgi:hypothetical protein